MPIKPHIDRTKQLTIFVCNGKITPQHIIEALTAVFAEGLTKDVLWDLRRGELEIDDPTAQIEQLAKLSDQEREIRAQGKTALVGSDDFTYGVLRMYETFAEIHGLVHEVQVFRGMEEARRWIEGE